ncbi:hypothetical protein CHUAL_002970 [Chamberlinius hualienensis]
MATAPDNNEATVVVAKPERKHFSGSTGRRNVGKTAFGVPAELLADVEIARAMSILPSNYNFDIHRTIWRIRTTKAKKVALQFPEGLTLYADCIAEILETFTQTEVMIIGEVTYGACCIEDLMAKYLDADLLVHYGHSCLIPVDTSSLKMFYVFVDIKADGDHFVASVRKNFPANSRIAFVSTVQFLSSIQMAAVALKDDYKIVIPQIHPLSPGEILGCTSPRVSDVESIIYFGDGRFHIESIMISNPEIAAYRYNPYDKKFTREVYDMETMEFNRKNAIEKARCAKTFGIIFGTLGRQGNTNVLDHIESKLKAAGKDYIVVLMSEIFPQTLKEFSDVDAWVQIACPRLSVDWGHEFAAPLLTPFELAVALNEIKYDKYPMDFYARDSLGKWTPNYREKKDSFIKSTGKKIEGCCNKCSDNKCSKS